MTLVWRIRHLQEYYDAISQTHKQAQAQAERRCRIITMQLTLGSQRKERFVRNITTTWAQRISDNAAQRSRQQRSVGEHWAVGSGYGAPTSGYSETSRIRAGSGATNQIAQYDVK